MVIIENDKAISQFLTFPILCNPRKIPREKSTTAVTELENRSIVFSANSGSFIWNATMINPINTESKSGFFIRLRKSFSRLTGFLRSLQLK